MSNALRGVLLSGCALVAALEAPEASAWLRDGLMGPYAIPHARQSEQTVADLPGSLPYALRLTPMLLALTPFSRSSFLPLAVER
jgi:hypothetical protein